MAGSLSKSSPIATYRLQLRNGMTFDRAVDIIPYLKRLGISHLYASPIFTAVTGSTHGYDIVDYNQIDPAIGGEQGFARLHAALRRKGMGLILDIVPNHMAASLENRWWRSVVEHGADSPFSGHFDVDWARKLTLPVLDLSFGEALSSGELVIDFDVEQGCLVLASSSCRVPLHPPTYRLIADRFEEPDASLTELLIKLSCTRRKATGQSLHAARPDLLGDSLMPLNRALAAMSADIEFVSRLHDAQPWRLTFWQDARHNLSYRRFFEEGRLVGVRVEDDAVFDDVQRLVLSLVRAGMADGLRVDHVDGLACPGGYLDRLRREVGPDIWILVEKILGRREQLPATWPDCGTTGYEFIPAAADLLVDADGLDALRQAYEAFVGAPVDTTTEMRAAKLLILKRNFQGELHSLAVAASQIALAGIQRPFSIDEIQDGIAEIIVGFSVYRTYGEVGQLEPQSWAALDGAERSALACAPSRGEVIRFVGELLRMGDTDLDGRAARFRIRFQQLTGPVMAKAVEDTVFYRANHLIALNEVGSQPGAEVGSVKRFHEAMRHSLAHPLGLHATATHDTKRGEDARARLYVLTECPQVWSAAIERWSTLNACSRPSVGGGAIPDPSVEWSIYQALAGVWPVSLKPDDRQGLEALAERFLPYVTKALREAKLHTDWLAIDEAYEAAVAEYVAAIMDVGNVRFLSDFARTIGPIMEAGALNSLSQTLAKLTVPGIPDIYQGSEVMDLSLVDPDNRRPVDFSALSAKLERNMDAGPSDLFLADGSLKQWIIARCLACRWENEALFARGRYTELAVSGAAARHYAAYLRQDHDRMAVVVLSRLSLQTITGSDSLPATLVLPRQCWGQSFQSVLSGGSFIGAGHINLKTMLVGLPVMLAVAHEPASFAPAHTRECR